MGMKDYFDFEHSMGEHWNLVYSEDYGYSGAIYIPLGIVDVLVYSKDTNYPYTKMWFVHNGKLTSRMWSETFTQRTIVTLAKRFAKEISDE